MKISVPLQVCGMMVAVFGALACVPVVSLADSDMKQGVKRQVAEASLTSAKATIESIDYDKRTVTIVDASGESETLQVDEIARNFEHAKVGDVVTVDYYEAFALSLKPATGQSPGAGKIGAVSVAPAGDKPGIALVGTHVLTGFIEAINYKARTAAVRGPHGNIVDVEVDEESPMDNINVGDKVVAEYTMAIAISVRAPEE
jgi:transcriptional antiterminator Rof (Rho-off)